MTNDELEKENSELRQMFGELVKQVSTLVGVVAPQKEDCKYTLYQWLEVWLETYKKPAISQKTLTETYTRMRLHILPYLQDKPLNLYTGLEIQTALNNVQYERTRQCVYNIYNGAFTKAYKLGLIPQNIMANVDSVKHAYKEGKAMTKKQQAEFLKAIRLNGLERLYYFYLYTGCRMSEALSVSWADVDFRKKVIRIHGTKTEKSERTLPLFESLEEILKAMPDKKGLLFPYSVNKVKCNFRRVKEKLSFPLHIHELRHTFATRCIESGISLKVLQLWLGHSNMQTTANIYSHILSDFERDEALKFSL